MAVNFGTITKALEALLNEQLNGSSSPNRNYSIERNPERNDDYDKAARGKGWIGIWKGTKRYIPHTTGDTPWNTELTIIVEVQAVSFRVGSDAEDKLQAAETEVMDVLQSTDGLKISGTVGICKGYDVAYESYEGADDDAVLYFESAVITITAEVRA
jgi:hypothetical protein